MTQHDGEWPVAYIRDGYTQEAYLRGVFNVYGPCRFVFRPAQLGDRAVIYNQITQAVNDARKAEMIQCAAVARYVSSWDLKKPDGEALPIKSEEISRLRPKLVMRMFNIICGEEGGDVDPEADRMRSAAQIDDELHQALTGSTPEEREAASEKN